MSTENRKRMARNARRWTDAKLDKELFFAEAFAPPIDEAQADWLDVIRAEAKARLERSTFLDE